MEKIYINDILKMTDEQIERTRVRFMVSNEGIGFDPNSYEAEGDVGRDKINLVDLVFNRESSIPFKEGSIAIGFVRIRDDYWLMTGIVKVLKDNGFGQPATAEYLSKKYNFRLVVKFHKDFQNGIVRADSVFDKLEVIEIWSAEKGLNDKSFPGYKNVKIGYLDLKKKIEVSDEWRAALRSRKGVYLIVDKQTGKIYVGSAYGVDGLLGRWSTYVTSGYDKDEVENGKYPNKRLQEVVRDKGISYVEENFQYSLLETFTEDVSDEYIIARESFWKEVLLSREFGYNAN